MPMHQPLPRVLIPLLFLFTAWALVAEPPKAQAAEAGFGTYLLGGNAFGAGVTPPPGTYVTSVFVYIDADIGGAVPFNRVTLNAGASVEFFVSALNVLYVPERKVLGGTLGLGVTVPVGHMDLEATIGIGPLAASREVDGWGLGDIVPRIQLGWNTGDFSHLIWLQAVTPTGRYSPTFAPNIGLNRPGIDTGLAATYTHKPTKLQFNGAAGVTFNFENDETDYRSGTEFHFEWAIGRELSPGLVVGIAGYDYRQLTGDSGSGANLGPFKGRLDGIGPGLSYTTLIGKTPFVFNLRHYREFNGERHFEGNQTVASGTIRF
jgi:hypothetical protein